MRKMFIRDLPKLVNCGLSYPISESGFNIYQKLYLKPIAIMPIKISDLKCAISLDLDDVLKPFFKKPNSQIDRSIINSPHLEFIEYYKNYGLRKLRKNFRELNYYKMLIAINKIGYKTNYFNLQKIALHYNDKSIWKRMQSFIKLFKSIQQIGYLGGRYQGNYVSILEIPLVITRFDWDINYEPFEVFLGHHRAACLAALGFNAADVLVLKDTKGVF